MLRLPAVAGQFYPEDKKELEAVIGGFLAEAKSPKIKGDIFALLLPHAGYIYSGPVAACGFKAIAGKVFDTVIIIGDSHHERFDGVSFWPQGQWQTPLGKVPIDEDLAQKIISESKRFFRRDSAHLWEHSIEVQLPFLQKTLGNFKILPIIFGSEDEDWKLLAEVILKNIKGKRVLVIASADLSHYLSYENAKKVDEKTLGNVLNLQVDNLDICAIDSAKTIIEITKNLGGKAKLLKYLNSGDTAGDPSISLGAGKSKVVGYGAVAFYLEGCDYGAELLHIAKISVETFLKERKIPEFQINSEKLKEKRGVFVTLKKSGELRGCIGYTAGDRPLYQLVSQMALAAAFEDPRFEPVTKEELPELEYEISVLSPLKKINSWQEIELGRHGVQASAEGRTALFLPQVAKENNWDLETFLTHLMLKAGLPQDYWKNNRVDFYVFEAEVVKDKKRNQQALT